MHPLVKLARDTIESYVNNGTVPPPPVFSNAEMRIRAGVFVSIHLQDGELRGCIGTIEPTQPSIAEEVIHNAISSATRDPRFPPIRPEELSDLEISVDVLTQPEEVRDHSELDAKKYGVIVQRGSRRGLLLPDLEGVETPAQQIDIALRKAGINPKEPYDLFRFEVKRYH